MDVLNTGPNQRVDLSDFLYGTQRSVLDGARQTAEALLISAAAPMSVVRGFKATSPGSGQVRVGNGSALLGLRQNAELLYGVAYAGGPSERILDVSGYSAGTYGVFIRLSLTPGDVQSRVFWDASNGGREYVQTVSTRLRGNWDLRVELGSPGADWLRVASVVLPAVIITDERPLYFEGVATNNYVSSWGSSSDRSADRGTATIGDMPTFVRAMQQCLEDIKGRGLRRWWDKSIGGMNVGFDAEPTEDRLAVGSNNLALAENTTGGVVARSLSFHTIRAHGLTYGDVSQEMAIFSRTVKVDGDWLSTDTSASQLFSNKGVVSAGAYPNGAWVFGTQLTTLANALGIVNISCPTTGPGLMLGGDNSAANRGALFSGGVQRYVEMKAASSTKRFRLQHNSSDQFALRRYDDASGLDSTGNDLLACTATSILLATGGTLQLRDVANSRDVLNYSGASTVLSSPGNIQLRDTTNSRDALLYTASSNQLTVPPSIVYPSTKTTIYRTAGANGYRWGQPETSGSYVNATQFGSAVAVTVATTNTDVYGFYIVLKLPAAGSLTALSIQTYFQYYGGAANINGQYVPITGAITSLFNYNYPSADSTATLTPSFTAVDLSTVSAVVIGFSVKKSNGTGFVEPSSLEVRSVAATVQSTALSIPSLG